SAVARVSAVARGPPSAVAMRNCSRAPCSSPVSRNARESMTQACGQSFAISTAFFRKGRASLGLPDSSRHHPRSSWLWASSGARATALRSSGRPSHLAAAPGGCEGLSRALSYGFDQFAVNEEPRSSLRLRLALAPRSPGAGPQPLLLEPFLGPRL